MRAIPVAGARGFARLARRTTLIRGLLAVALVALVVCAAAAARHPSVRKPSLLPAKSGDMIVLDLSASISSDTFNRIGETLRKLVASNGHYGLVIFSNVAYEALPPGTPASALEPLVRYFTVPVSQTPGAAAALPTSPWLSEFSSGTRISAGLDLAHRILLAHGLKRSGVLLISDLNDDPADLERLNDVVVGEYGHGGTPLRVVALDPSPADQAYFQRAAGKAIADAAAPVPGAPPVATTPSSSLPMALVVAIVATMILLAVHSVWSARLRWDVPA